MDLQEWVAVVNGTLHGVACRRTFFPSGRRHETIQTPDFRAESFEMRLPGGGASRGLLDGFLAEQIVFHDERLHSV